MRKLLVAALIMLSFLSTSLMLKPASASAAVAAGCDGSRNFLIFPTWYKYLDIGPDGNDPCAIIGPVAPALDEEGNPAFDDEGNPATEFDWEAGASRVGIAIVEILLRIATLAALGFVIYGGFRYITSQGEPDGTKSAKQTILNALIGLVISLLATGIVAFIANELVASSAEPAQPECRQGQPC